MAPHLFTRTSGTPGGRPAPLSRAATAGVVVGVIAFMILLWGGMCWCAIRRRRARRANMQLEPVANPLQYQYQPKPYQSEQYQSPQYEPKPYPYQSEQYQPFLNSSVQTEYQPEPFAHDSPPTQYHAPEQAYYPPNKNEGRRW